MRKATLIVDRLPRVAMERDAIADAQCHTAYEVRRYLLRLVCDEDPGEVLRRKALDGSPGRAWHMAGISADTLVGDDRRDARTRGGVTDFDMHWICPLGTRHTSKPHAYHRRD